MTRADPLHGIRIVLCETSHPGNIGAAARAMKTMGLADLRLVAPHRFPDPEARWRAARALDVLDTARVDASLDDALHGTALAVACTARTREIALTNMTVRQAAARAIAVANTQPVAIVFGNETSGLTAEQVLKCSLTATIPANPDYTSLNLAAAVQVFGYELRLAAIDPEPAGVRAQETAALAPHEEVEAFYVYLESLMADAGFLNPDQPKRLMPKLRRLFARAGLEREEVNILRGLLKSISRNTR